MSLGCDGESVCKRGTFTVNSLNCGNVDNPSKLMGKLCTHVHAISRWFYSYCGQFADTKANQARERLSAFACNAVVVESGFVWSIEVKVEGAAELRLVSSSSL